MTAALNGRTYPDLPGCVNCGEPVRFGRNPSQTVHFDPEQPDYWWVRCDTKWATMPPEADQ